MIAKSANVSQSDVGAERALSAKSFIGFEQETSFKNVRFVVFYSCRMTVFQQIAAHDKMIEHTPLTLKLVRTEISFANAMQKHIV